MVSNVIMIARKAHTRMQADAPSVQMVACCVITIMIVMNVRMD